MPVSPTYPGVNVEEVPSGVGTITGVATSITAFVGRARRGPVNSATRIQSFGDYVRRFGGLWAESTMSYAVQQYFLNGGRDGIIVRVQLNATAATIALPVDPEDLPAGSLDLAAANPGAWSGSLRAGVDHETAPSPTPLFNLGLEEINDEGEVASTESFRNLSVSADHPRFVTTVLEQQSELVRAAVVPAERPAETDSESPIEATGGGDGDAVTDTEISDPGLQTTQGGLYALNLVDLFNLLCIPPLARETDIGTATRDAAVVYCEEHRAMFIVDPPSDWGTTALAETGIAALNLTSENAAIFFPRINAPDPLSENRLETFAPCGAVAGIFVRTDSERGVWKAPAGRDATLNGVQELSVKLTDGENSRLNPLGVNCLRSFPGVGKVVWGSRTLRGADRLASDWKYVPVRRLALFLEESIYRSTKWVVFEPNDEPLWVRIRRNLGAFMQNLFRQGAFQGITPSEAYFVKCDSETTTQTDINLGIVKFVVGFAPLKPAEFVIIKIQQIAGQIAT